MFGFHVRVATAQREPARPLQGPLGPVCERQLTITDVHGRDRLRCLASEPVERRTAGHKGQPRRTVTIGEDPEDKVLGADLRVAESTRLVLSKRHDPLGSKAESLELVHHPRESGTLAPVEFADGDFDACACKEVRVHRRPQLRRVGEDEVSEL